MFSRRRLADRTGIRMVLACVVCAAALGGCGTPGPGGSPDTYGIDFSIPAAPETSGAIVFLIDGLNAEMFEEMLTAGELPAIRKYFVDRGLYAPRAVANTPSVTLANLTSIVTGRFCGHHGIIGINWFDRNRLIWRNYETIAQKNTLDGDYIAPTIFEQFPDRTTFSIFYQPHRGATKFVENWISAGPPFFFGWYEFVDRITLFRLNIVADVARKRRRWAALTFIYLLSPDFRAYKHGLGAREYRDAIRHADRQIGRVCGDLERAGLLDKLHLAIVSDHGHHSVTKHFPLEKFLRDEVNLKVARKRLWEKTPFEKRLEYYREYPAVTNGSGDRYFAICLRKPNRSSPDAADFEPWPIRPSPNDLKNYPIHREPSFLEKLLGRPASERADTPVTKDLLTILTEQEAVDVVAYPAGPDRVRVRRKGGEVEFRQDGGRRANISYHLIAGEDPPGWKGQVPAAALDGAPLSSREWLTATRETDYPDLPAQIVAYFRSRVAGDVAVFAAPGWDLFETHRAGHGGLGRDDMLVPMLLVGPGVPHGRIEDARTVDLTPTLLHLLGRDLPPGLDGRSLLERATVSP